MELAVEKLESQVAVQESQIKRLKQDVLKNQLQNDLLTEKISELEKESVKLKKKLEEGQRVVGSQNRDGLPNRGNLSKKHAFEVFPEEIWTTIFEQLRDPRVLRSLYHTCIDFQDMLRNQRVTFLFADVLKILATHSAFVSGDTPRTVTSRIMNLRLVSYGWKQCVDSFLQDDSPIFPSVSSKRYAAVASPFKPYKNVWNSLNLAEFPAETNPLPSRYLEYDETHPAAGISNRERKTFRKLFKEFLKKFGHHVWYFKVQFHLNENSSSFSNYWYNRLVSWLEFMPNLQSLYILCPMKAWWGADDDRHDDSGDECSESGSSHVLKMLHAAIKRKPFPSMPSLKTILFQDCPPCLIDTVLQANLHIERIKIERDDSNKVELELNKYELKMLQEASLTLVADPDFMDGLKHVNWSITKLSVKTSKIKWAALFDVLSTAFGECLEELDLNLTVPSGSEEPLKLNLRNLKVLNLKIARYFKAIDFILPLKKLERLKVDLTHMYQYRYEKQAPGNYGAFRETDYKPVAEILEIIQLHQFTHNMKKSNIWQLFPRLKVVMARTDRRFGNDGVTPCVSSDWQSCSREMVDL